MDDATRPAVLTTRQAAAYLGLSHSFLCAARLPQSRIAGPPWVKIGRSVRYVRAHLDAWLEERAQATRSRARTAPSASLALHAD